MKKNTSGQVIGAELVDATTGAAFTGAVTCHVTGDGGTQAVGSVGAGACTHEGNGFHTYAPAQAETNYDHVAFTFTGTGAVPVTIQVFTAFPQTGDAFSRIGANGAGLTQQPWNAAWDAEVQSEVADALAAYDPPTKAEMDARTILAANYSTLTALDVKTQADQALVDALLDSLGLGLVVGTVQSSPVPTTTTFRGDSGLSNTLNFYNKRQIAFITGNMRPLGGYVTAFSTDRDFTIHEALPSPGPSGGDKFIIMGGRV